MTTLPNTPLIITCNYNFKNKNKNDIISTVNLTILVIFNHLQLIISFKLKWQHLTVISWTQAAFVKWNQTRKFSQWWKETDFSPCQLCNTKYIIYSVIFLYIEMIKRPLLGQRVTFCYDHNYTLSRRACKMLQAHRLFIGVCILTIFLEESSGQCWLSLAQSMSSVLFRLCYNICHIR